MYYVYILKSLKDNNFYIGTTNNVQRRLKEHNSGKSKSTKSRIPFKLIYKEKYKTLSEARKREWYFKSYPMGQQLKKKLALRAYSSAG